MHLLQRRDFERNQDITAAYRINKTKQKHEQTPMAIKSIPSISRTPLLLQPSLSDSWNMSSCPPAFCPPPNEFGAKGHLESDAHQLTQTAEVVFAVRVQHGIPIVRAYIGIA
jgi:hypothetical protein